MRCERISLDLQGVAQMSFGLFEITIVPADNAQHQTRGVVLSLLEYRAFEIAAGKHRLIKFEKVLADEQRNRDICRVEHQSLFEVTYAALWIALGEEVRSRIQ